MKRYGNLFLSSPYIWNADISQEWLETENTKPHDFVVHLLQGKQIPECGFNYRIIMEKMDIPWNLRKQDNNQFLYLVDMILGEKTL